MAEGGADEDSGDVMLAAAAGAVNTTASKHHHQQHHHHQTHHDISASAAAASVGPPQHQPLALNLKAEESDRESSVGSPEPASIGSPSSVDNVPPPTTASIVNGGLYHHQQQQQQQTQQQQQLMMAAAALHASRLSTDSGATTPGVPTDPPTIDPAKVAAAAAAAHLNGTMAGMVTLQNLQNFASLQQNLPLAAAAGLQGLSTQQVINAPLNLSVSATSTAPTNTNNSTTNPSAANLLASAAGLSTQQNATSIPSLLNPAQQPAPMPQFILASGQLVHGIQGAQLLIPTSQGIATQTILTIPVNHVNSSDQIVNLALNNGQVVTTSLANLQAMAQPHHLLTSVANTVPTTNTPIASGLLNTASLPHLLQNSATSAQQLMSAMRPQTLLPAATPEQSLLTTVPTSTLLSSHKPPSQSSTPGQHVTRTNQSGNHSYGSSSSESSSKHQQNGAAPGSNSSASSASSASAAALNSISRLQANNSEITITTTHGPALNQHPIKVSPSSVNLSPTCTDNSTADLLIDSPNQPTINQTNSNVVDGINLDEIKEFAKAFKLRRLSLGLTQTQVGQALSVTEGPAYSQSAICSALATQMYCAAQLSSQQQAMFEKLDITPKSAQKIKPVLERWMKEAEERYKSGQNHLTDFIGVEPSKKRKRRTSFTPQALELLNAHFERNTHPSGTEITGLAHQLGYEREVIRIWFCNKRQALKNTVRMMSKGMV